MWEEGQAKIYAVLRTLEPLEETLPYAVQGHSYRWMTSLPLGEVERGKDDQTWELLSTHPRSNLKSWAIHLQPSWASALIPAKAGFRPCINFLSLL